MASPARTRPPLHSGDRLNRAAFHAIYRERDDLTKAELVQGVVYLPSPAGFEGHAKPQALIGLWLGSYAARHDELDSGVEATVLLDGDTEVQPDGLLFRRGAAGTATISREDFIEGAPELIVEVASSSASYDLHDKKEAYLAAGVGECSRVCNSRVSASIRERHWMATAGGCYRHSTNPCLAPDPGPA
jgi:Uma2 family endonuclease